MQKFERKPVIKKRKEWEVKSRSLRRHHAAEMCSFRLGSLIQRVLFAINISTDVGKRVEVLKRHADDVL